MSRRNLNMEAIPDSSGIAGRMSGPPTRASSRLGSYLRRLREGYGYTLRKVEERAMALGEALDNSQLSRFEKGKAVPSFDKLRALARVFNVSVQNFSDVLDLEEFESFKPDDGDYDPLIEQGATLYSRGEHGAAFVTFERAFEVARDEDEHFGTSDRIAKARWHMACALKALGKLSMAEFEFRAILKGHRHIPDHVRANSLLNLCYLYRERGDLYLASVLARESLEQARDIGDRRLQAGVLNTLGSILCDENRHEDALEQYNLALEALEKCPGSRELHASLMTNLGGCLVQCNRFDEGVDALRRAHRGAREQGYRRVAALSLTRLGEAFVRRGDYEQAKSLFTESDCLASRPTGAYHDILFLNAFRRWELARQEENRTREKIAFGRLRHLRSLLQSRFVEVDEFDRHVEKTRRHA